MDSINDVTGRADIDPQQTEVPQQSTKSKDEWQKERMNTIMVVATVIAAIAFQAVINPPGGVFQEDSKINAVEEPVRFIYYLRRVISNPAMTEGFRSYNYNIIPQTAAYRINFVRSLLAAANQSASFTLGQKYLAPGIVLYDDSLRDVISNYNQTGALSSFSPYLLRYAGTAIFAYTSPKAYEAYIILNSLSLAVCGLTILACTFDVVEQRPSATSIVGYLEALVATAVACIFVSYTIVIKTIVPPFYDVGTINNAIIVVLIAAIVMLLFIFVFHDDLSSDPESGLRRFLRKPLCRTKQFPWPPIKVILFILVLLSLWSYFIGWETVINSY